MLMDKEMVKTVLLCFPTYIIYYKQYYVYLKYDRVKQRFAYLWRATYKIWSIL